MKTKTILASALLATIALNAVAPTVSAEITYDDATSSVGFKAPDGDGSTDPSEVTPPATKPPIGPVTPGPDEPGQGGTSGPLALSVPKDLRFGTDNAIDLKGATYNALTTTFVNDDFPAAEDGVVLPPMIVVKDVRGLKDGNWDLQVGASEFYEYEGATKGEILAGLTISFKDAKIFNSQDENFDGSKITNKGNVTLSSAATSLMSADHGNGNGETTYIADSRYQVEGAAEIYKKTDRADGIQLSVPAPASSKIKVGSTYKAELTWTLLTTPDAGSSEEDGE